ncbi:hypothetical protein HYX19_01655 [Candidatus Woesearchaeota archaeon]|nr:hypothetical protein [Candidatus Woesearchaeota archaeon]
MELKNWAGAIQVASLALIIISSFFLYDDYKSNAITKGLCSLSPGFGTASLIITLISSTIILILAILIEGDQRYFIKGKLYDPSLMLQNILLLIIIILIIAIRNIINNYKHILCFYNISFYIIIFVLLFITINLYKEYGRLR